MRHSEKCPGDRDNISVLLAREKIKGVCLLSEMSISVPFSGGQTFLQCRYPGNTQMSLLGHSKSTVYFQMYL